MRITDNRGMEDAFHHTRDIYYSVPTPDILRSRNLGPGESDFLLPGLWGNLTVTSYDPSIPEDTAHFDQVKEEMPS